MFGGHEDRAPALAHIVSYMSVLGQKELRCHGVQLLTHFQGKALLQLYVLGQPWTHQTRPCVQVSVHRQRVVLVEEGASWLT